LPAQPGYCTSAHGPRLMPAAAPVAFAPRRAGPTAPRPAHLDGPAGSYQACDTRRVGGATRGSSRWRSVTLMTRFEPDPAGSVRATPGRFEPVTCRVCHRPFERVLEWRAAGWCWRGAGPTGSR